MAQAALGVITKLLIGVGAPAATAGAAAGATAISLAGTAISTVAAISASRYQAAVLRRNAAIELMNAQRIRDAGRVQAQDADFEAAAEMGQLIAQQAASGFAVSSQSYIRRRQKNRIRASVNRLRIVDDAEMQARSAEERARGYRAEARAKGAEAFFSLLSGGVGFGQDLIGGANLASNILTRRIGRNAANVGVY